MGSCPTLINGNHSLRTSESPSYILCLFPVIVRGEWYREVIHCLFGLIFVTFTPINFFVSFRFVPLNSLIRALRSLEVRRHHGRSILARSTRFNTKIKLVQRSP